MIRRDAVSQKGENTRVINGLNIFNFLIAQIIKKGWLLDIGGFFIPVKGLTLLRFDFAPASITLKDIRIAAFKHAWLHSLARRFGNIMAGRPDIREIDRIAFFVMTNRVGCEIDFNRTGNGIGNNQQR